MSSRKRAEYLSLCIVACFKATTFYNLLKERVYACVAFAYACLPACVSVCVCLLSSLPSESEYKLLGSRSLKPLLSFDSLHYGFEEIHILLAFVRIVFLHMYMVNVFE